MARMPGAVWKPLPRASKTKMARYDLYVVHTMVGSLAGTDGYFRGLTNGINSHFGIGGYGENWQWVDTAVRSGANGAGNPRAITAENADMGPGFKAWNTRDGSAVPALTPQQIETNAQNLAWAHRTHGVPLQLAPNSLPGSRGLAYHRLGIDPWRVPGGEVWSASRGKVCPADRRVAQIPLILGRAREIVHSKPAPAPQQEDDMTPAESKLLADIGRQVAYLTGQVEGQETDKTGKKGWIAADQRAYSLVDLNRATYRAVLKAMDVNALATEIVAKLPASSGGGASKDDVKTAIREFFADAVDPA